MILVFSVLMCIIIIYSIYSIIKKNSSFSILNWFINSMLMIGILSIFTIYISLNQYESTLLRRIDLIIDNFFTNFLK